MKKGVLENFAKFLGKHLWFANFSKSPFLQLPLAFLCNVTKIGFCQQCLENTVRNANLRSTVQVYIISFFGRINFQFVSAFVYTVYCEKQPSEQMCSVKKGVLKDFVNFIGKHLCWSLFLIAGLTPILKNIFQRLLLRCTCTTHFYHGVIRFTFTFFLILTTTTVNISNTCFWFKLKMLQRIRSSHQRCFILKGVLRKFEKFTGKNLCQSLFLIKFIKKETLAQIFSWEFCKISKNTFFIEQFRTTAS